MEDKKKQEEGVWICDCGKETPQPSGHDVKIITKCECGKELNKMREPDGFITEYVSAPEWFYKEFEESLNATGQKEAQLSQLAFNFFKAIRQGLDFVSELTASGKKRKHMIEQGLKRTKLFKRQDMVWRYNVPMRKFLGRKREDLEKKSVVERG